MSSSGLIYAVIVGAWAAYLVPMWLRRQDELNESRPTERFSTAIRLLSGRSALERRASRSRADGTTGGAPGAGPVPDASGDTPAPDLVVPEAAEPPAVPVRAASAPDVEPPHRDVARPDTAAAAVAAMAAGSSAADRGQGRPTAEPRARLLARRRRMVTALFLAFALGAVVAAVAGFAFIWVPALPAALLTLYIGHLRRLERQRYEVKLDRVAGPRSASIRKQTPPGSWHRCENAHTDGVTRPVRKSMFPPQIRRHMDRSDHIYRENHKRSLFRTPRMSAAILPASLMPFATSTPLDTSTAQGRVRWIASATLPGCSPPDRISGNGNVCGIKSQSNECPVPPGSPAT